MMPASGNMLHIAIDYKNKRRIKVGELIASQKQAVINLIKRKAKTNDLLQAGKRFLFSTLEQNWFQKF